MKDELLGAAKAALRREVREYVAGVPRELLYKELAEGSGPQRNVELDATEAESGEKVYE